MTRGCGVLLPVFSLTSDYGIGTFGKEAYRFISFLAASGQSYWQMLPLNPTSYGDSPYQSFSAFALNPYFIDLEMLAGLGYLSKEDLRPLAGRYSRTIDYGRQYAVRFGILDKAYRNSGQMLKEELDAFRRKNAFWLDDYAMFMVIKAHFGGRSWLEWDDSFRCRDRATMTAFREKHVSDIYFWIWCQYIADSQYQTLRSFAGRNHIKIIGDIPIYVASDSADVWANFGLFQFGPDRFPTAVAGVPPDYFSKTGQLWGNPLYDWDKMKANGFAWWRSRVRKCSESFDVLRIDHFRGMEAYWAVPYGDKTAVSGKWVKGPGISLVSAIKEAAGKMAIIAEDLGFMTDDVIRLKEESGWPGLCVYQFGFDLNDRKYGNPYLPENYKPNCVAYIGTHDNDTLLHFLETQDELRPFIFAYLKTDDIDTAYGEIIDRIMRSAADTVILTMQDWLREDGQYRINTPGTSQGNWLYRLPADYDSPSLESAMLKLALDAQRK